MKLDENTIKEMFSDMKFLISKMQKEDYSKNFEIFESKYTTFFENMVEAFDLEGYTSSMPLDFFEIALNDFKRFGKVRKSIKVDVSMFLIYYVFPLIIKIEKEKPCDASDNNIRISLSEALCKKWRIISENQKFNYADYDTIKNSFEKTFMGFKMGD